MLFVSIAPFILAAQSIAQNHWIMTSMVESDQKDNLVQTYPGFCLFHNISHTQPIWSL